MTSADHYYDQSLHDPSFDEDDFLAILEEVAFTRLTPEEYDRFYEPGAHTEAVESRAMVGPDSDSAPEEPYEAHKLAMAETEAEEQIDRFLSSESLTRWLEAQR